MNIALAFSMNLSVFLGVFLFLFNCPLWAVDFPLVSDALEDPTNAYHSVLKKISNRMVRVERGAGVIAGINEDGQPIILTVNHLLPINQQAFLGVKSPMVMGFDHMQHPTKFDARYGDARLSYVSHKVFTPAIAVSVAENPDLWPSDEDLAIGVMTGLQQDVGEFLFADYDPSSPNESSIPTENLVFDFNSEVGTEVIIVGNPGTQQGDLSYTVGKLLSDSEAEILINNSKDITEKNMPFKKGLEALVAAPAEGGFSGGGVFSLDGRYLGALTRGDTVEYKFARFIKVQTILDTAKKAYSDEANNLTQSILKGSGIENYIFDSP